MEELAKLEEERGNPAYLPADRVVKNDGAERIAGQCAVHGFAANEELLKHGYPAFYMGMYAKYDMLSDSAWNGSGVVPNKKTFIKQSHLDCLIILW